MSATLKTGSFATGHVKINTEYFEAGILFREFVSELMDELGLKDKEAKEQFELLLRLRRDAALRKAQASMETLNKKAASASQPNS